MNALGHLREQFAASAELDEKIELECAFSRAGSVAERAEIGGRIADLLESFAERMDRSGLVRVTAQVKSAAERRAEAAVWRSGRDPHEGQRDG